MPTKVVATLLLCTCLSGCGLCKPTPYRDSFFENSYVKDIMGVGAAAMGVLSIITLTKGL